MKILTLEEISVIISDMQNPIVILGSSRSDGNTLKAIHAVIEERGTPIIDLREHTISYYDYAGSNQHDDFIALAEQMMGHNPIILATPVYWYSMSGIMKTFLDRWTDLLDLRKDLGYKLKGKELYLITSFAGEMPKGFEDPFSQTCKYLKMHYKGCLYHYSGDNKDRREQNALLARAFREKIWHESCFVSA